MKRILAIDPGINGAAVLFVGGSVVPVEPGGLIDLPTIGSEKQREIDGLALRDWMLQMQPDVAVVEQVNAMPSLPGDEGGGQPRKMGAVSAFNFGGTYRLLKWLPLLFNIPTHIVTSPKWKKHYGIVAPPKGGGLTAAKRSAIVKEKSRQQALQHWPCLAPLLARKLDADRAEACLIANYYWETELRG